MDLPGRAPVANGKSQSAGEDRALHSARSIRCIHSQEKAGEWRQTNLSAMPSVAIRLPPFGCFFRGATAPATDSGCTSHSDSVLNPQLSTFPFPLRIAPFSLCGRASVLVRPHLNIPKAPSERETLLHSFGPIRVSPGGSPSHGLARRHLRRCSSHSAFRVSWLRVRANSQLSTLNSQQSRRVRVRD